MEDITPSKAYALIQLYYLGKHTASHGVPYINHIDEGLRVLRHLKASNTALIVYTLHPIFQGEEFPGRVIHDLSMGTILLEDNLFNICAEYATVANSYLYRSHNIGDVFVAPPMHEAVKLALIADKIQNNKDFHKYHVNTHKRRMILMSYFNAWFKALGLSDDLVVELTALCNNKPKLVFFTGAGVSAESGIQTFRDEDGLWEGYDVMDVATLRGWKKDREKVLRFYNERIAQLHTVNPNSAHHKIAELEEFYDVTVITQNVDDLHERAGSSKVLHLHGELLSKCSSMNKETHITEILPGESIELGTKAPDGSQWRPYVVWFGEPVPNMVVAEEVMKNVDVVVIVGTSLNVYPAASLVMDLPTHVKKYVIDPNLEPLADFELINTTAKAGMKILYDKIAL